MFYAIVISLVVGFAGGWAFFKHRADVKAKIAAEANDLRNSIKAKL